MKTQALQVVSFIMVLLTVGVFVLTPAFLGGLLGNSSEGVLKAQVCPPDDPKCIFDKEGYLEQADLGLPATDLRSLTISIINILLGILGIVFLLFILYGGFLWMVAGGDADRAKKGQTIIGHGIVGLIVIFVAFALVTFVFNILGETIREA